MHIAVHSLTSRCTRRVASRIVTGPALANARINPHRLAVNSWNRGSGAAKLTVVAILAKSAIVAGSLANLPICATMCTTEHKDDNHAIDNLYRPR
jgi:hypothetical protein